MSTLTGPATIGPALVNLDWIVIGLTGRLVGSVDGATLTSYGALYRGTGIAVALPDHGIVLSDGDHDDRDVAAWVQRVARHVNASSRYAFGSWVQETGDATLLHLDVVEIFSDAEEADALAAGVARGQLAVFHHGRRECIMLDDEGWTDDDEQPDREPTAEQERAAADRSPHLREDEIRGHAIGGDQ